MLQMALLHKSVRASRYARRISKSRYHTTNWPSYNAALKSRGSLTIWLGKRLQCFTAASGKRGRSPNFSDAAPRLRIKNLFGLVLRQDMGMVESLMHLSGLHWPAPDFSTVCRRQPASKVHVPYHTSQAGLHLLVDSTGVKFLGEGERRCKKYGVERRRQWRKLHIGIGKGEIFAYCNAAVAACRRLVRRIWKVRSVYYRCSFVETKMNCIKRLGERVMSRIFERQVNGLPIRAAILNRFTELRRPQTTPVA